MLLIINKTKRANPPRGNLCNCEYCFLSETVSNTLSRWKLESLEAEIEKVQHTERGTMQRMMLCNTSCHPLLLRYDTDGVSERKLELREQDNYRSCCASPCGLTLLWQVADTFCHRCQTERGVRPTDRLSVVTALIWDDVRPSDQRLEAESERPRRIWRAVRAALRCQSLVQVRLTPSRDSVLLDVKFRGTSRDSAVSVIVKLSK